MPAPAKKKGIERKANHVTSYIRNRRSNAFYGSAIPTSTPSTSTSANNLTEKVNDNTNKNNDNEEVFSIVHQIMEDMLNRIEKAAHVLDEVIEACGKRLTTLKLVNATRSPFQMLSIVGFVNLKVLMISPHNLGDDLVECMGKYTNSTL